MAKNEDRITTNTRNVMRKVEQVDQSLSEVKEMLRTQADRAGAFGFGKRILVPPDEIHVVVGDGRHVWTTAKKSKGTVYGQAAEQPSHYWLNSLTQVIKLKTISFTVPLRGPNDEGIEALDDSQVSFLIWAHAVAKLNPETATVAAQRVGLDTTSLIKTITEVGTAELVSAAATMNLKDIIANRQVLAQKASQQVNKILKELGYDLALLTITRLDGEAYQKLVEQAEARISKEATIVTNQEQLAELKDRQERERREAEIAAETEKKLAAERLEAEQEVETATLAQQESLNVSRHEHKLKETKRAKVAAEATHEAELTDIELRQKRAKAEEANQAELAQAQEANLAKLAEIEAINKAKLARQEADRQAELRAVQQKRNAEIALAEAQAETARLALEQERKIERDAERTEAEAKRLRAEELAAAERAKEIALLEANQLGESLKVEAQAQAESTRLKAEAETRALRTRAEAESQTELVRAEAEADATAKRAQAAKIRAEATRAETAAPGLAQAEVEAAQVGVAEKQVNVRRAEGLAEAEVAQAKSDAEAERVRKLKQIEIEAEEKLAKLYEKTPVLVDIEKLKLEMAHEERLATIEAEARLKAFEAIAPSLNINIYGDGSQASRILTEIMSFSQGLEYLGQEVPLVGQLLPGPNGGNERSALLGGLSRFMPYLQQSLSDVNPRMLSSLKVSDLVDKLATVVNGQDDLVSAVNKLKDDASFRVVGDLPVKPILSLLGINLADKAKPSKASEDAAVIFDADDVTETEAKVDIDVDDKKE